MSDYCRLTSVPPEIFSDCTALFTLSLHNNPITAAALRDLKGFAEFDIRRRGKYSKQVICVTSFALCGSGHKATNFQAALGLAVSGFVLQGLLACDGLDIVFMSALAAVLPEKLLFIHLGTIQL